MKRSTLFFLLLIIGCFFLSDCKSDLDFEHERRDLQLEVTTNNPTYSFNNENYNVSFGGRVGIRYSYMNTENLNGSLLYSFSNDNPIPGGQDVIAVDSSSVSEFPISETINDLPYGSTFYYRMYAENSESIYYSEVKQAKLNNMMIFIKDEEEYKDNGFMIDDVIYALATNRYNNLSSSTDFTAYHTTTGDEEILPAFPGPSRSDYACFSIGEKGYVVGGASGIEDIWEFDTVDKKWEEIGEFDSNSNKGVFIVGFSIGETGYFVYKNELFAFYPSDDNSSSRKLSLPDEMISFYTNQDLRPYVSILNGKAYFWAGNTQQDFDFLFVFDPVTNTFETFTPCWNNDIAAMFEYKNEAYVLRDFEFNYSVGCGDDGQKISLDKINLNTLELENINNFRYLNSTLWSDTYQFENKIYLQRHVIIMDQ